MDPAVISADTEAYSSPGSLLRMVGTLPPWTEEWTPDIMMSMS